MRGFGLLVLLVVIVTLYMTSGARQTRGSDFYVKTQEALQAKEYQKATKERDADNVGSRLRAAEDAAKKSADDKNQKYLDSVGGGDGKSVAGRVMINEKGGEKKLQGVATVGGKPRDREASKGKSEQTNEDHEVEVELNAILKKSPSKFIILSSVRRLSHTNYHAQSLFSLNLTARSRRRQSTSSSTNTKSSLNPTSSNSTTTRSAKNSKRPLRKRPAAGPYQIS